MAKNEPIRVKFPARICFVRLAEPAENELSEKLEYSVECRIPKTDTKTIGMIREAMKKACIERFGDKPAKWPADFREDKFFETHLSKNGKDGFFLRDGDKKEAEDYHGQVFFTARQSSAPGKTPQQPKCGKRVGEGKWVALSGAKLEEEIYSGCFADVVIEVYAYPSPRAEATAKNKGIGAALKAVMKTGEGERMSGGAPVDMSEYFGEESTESFDAGEDDLDV